MGTPSIPLILLSAPDGARALALPWPLGLLGVEFEGSAIPTPMAQVWGATSGNCSLAWELGLLSSESGARISLACSIGNDFPILYTSLTRLSFQ